MNIQPGRHRTARLLTWVIVPLAALALGTPPAMAVGTTKVTGTVMDPDGKPLAGAKIQFLNQNVKTKVTPAKSNKKGKFSYPFLDISAAKSGQGGAFRVVPELSGYRIVRVTWKCVDSFGNTRDDGDRILDKDEEPPVQRFHLVGKGTAIVGKNEVHFVMAPEAAFARVRADLIAEKQAATAEAAGPPAVAEIEPAAPVKKKETPKQSFESGVELAAGGNHEGAVDALQAFLAAEPDHDRGHYELGKSLTELGRTDDAAAEFRRALELNPELPGAHFRIGVAYARAERYAEAEQEFRAELENSPEEASAIYNLTITLLQQGKADEAIPYLEQVVELQPDHADANWKLAKLYEQRGEFAMAEARYEAFASANPALAAKAFFNIGQQAFKRRDREEAAAAYRKALDVDPDHAEAHRQLGYCLVGLADFDAAIVHFKKYLELEPNSAYASEVRSTIGALQD